MSCHQVEDSLDALRPNSALRMGERTYPLDPAALTPVCCTAGQD